MFRLLIMDHICGCDYQSPCYVALGKYETRKQAQNAKRGYSFARSGVVNRAKEMAKAAGLRSPWKIEEV